MRGVAITGACVALALTTRGEVRACGGGGDWGITYETTFDPAVVGEPEGLGWDPYTPTFGGSCGDCLAKARDADWTGYLAGASAADWNKILDGATDSELIAMGRGGPPAKYARSSVWKADKARLAGALDYVRVARKLEPHLTLETNYPGAPTPPPEELLKRARDGISNKDPFLAQRYAYQAMRAAFYRSEWAQVIKLHDDNAAVLAKPSVDIKWNAEHYLAGALMRTGKRGRANLELARIAMAYPPLAGPAVFEFAPKDEADWREALRLAATTADKIALWRVVGIRKDGLIGAREVLALDPKSPYAALLVVRELTKLEQQVTDRWGPPDPADLAAQQKAFAAVEKLALDQLAKRGDRPYLWELITGHIAAIRGDVAATRARVGRAVAAQPNNARVVSQASASLAIAISRNWKIDATLEVELAGLWSKIATGFDRRTSVDELVRRRLAPVYLKAGKPEIAELLRKETVDQDSGTQAPSQLKWRSIAFIRELMARETSPKTPFDRFVAAGTYTQEELQFEISMRLLFDGDFAGALAAFDNKHSQKLTQDPFVLRIRDTYDADREKYKGAATYLSLLQRLVELDAKVKLGGEAGAEAAILIGNAIYNSTHFGISKWMASGSHGGSAADAELAVRYFKKAHDLSKNRETKTKAAFFAAKAEMIMRMADPQPVTPDPDEVHPPMPKTWYPVLKTYKGTRYYNQVIKECGRFAAWAK